MVISETGKTKQSQGRGIEKEINIAILNSVSFEQRPEEDGRETESNREGAHHADIFE